MSKYVIEREMPGIGLLSTAELQEILRNSSSIIAALGRKIRWIESYITYDKIYDVYEAENKALLRQHALQTGIPANTISEIAVSIGPNSQKGGRFQ